MFRTVQTGVKNGCRFSVGLALFLFVVGIGSDLFAAQCGGLPKGWHSPDADVAGALKLSSPDSETPLPQKPLPCRCTGASCSPVAPLPIPDQRVVTGLPQEALVNVVDRLVGQKSPSEFSDAVWASLRYEVVLGVFRPPCSQ